MATLAPRSFLLTEPGAKTTISSESGCGPVAAQVFKTCGRGDELRRWVRLPRALANYW